MTTAATTSTRFSLARLLVLSVILLTLVTGATVAAAQSFGSRGGHTTTHPVNPRCGRGCM